MREREGLPHLREQIIANEIARRIAQANASRRLRDVFRIVHFSIQDDHVHLMVEAADARLSRGVQGLAIRVARHVNALLNIRGRFWGDRFHSHELTSPREVRNAIVYVLMNVKKHLRGWIDCGADPCSSAPWFFSIGTTGWLRHGAIRLDERPARRSPLS